MGGYIAIEINLKNRFEIHNDELVLFLDRRNEESLKTVVDLDNLKKLCEENVKWYPKWDEDIQSYYAQATKYLGVDQNGKYKYKTLYLHKYVLDYAGRMKVDHINHDTLNNKRNNLRTLKDSHNSTNRKSKNKNNKSGYRNVCWIKSEQKWIVQISINKKNTRLGSFDDVHEAGRFAAAMRTKFYKDKKGFD
ncbi:hypothetical protein ACFQZE_06750 [Paenibacillus sp. GCM10027627]|uniref:hypothetical protein n=1 Tax=unclassified Paenibacillus TaxID=185978 RepID=UPI00362BD70C